MRVNKSETIIAYNRIVEQMDPTINKGSLLRPQAPNQIVSIDLRVKYVTLESVLLDIIQRAYRRGFFPQRISESRVSQVRIYPRRHEDHDCQQQDCDLPV